MSTRRRLSLVSGLAILAVIALWVGRPPGPKAEAPEVARSQAPAGEDTDTPVAPVLVGVAKPAAALLVPAPFEVRVLDSERRPVPDAQVYLAPAGRLYVATGERWSGSSGMDGRADVPRGAVTAGDTLVVRKEGLVPATVDAASLTEGTPRDIVLAHGETLSGVVVDPWGTPQPNVVVVVSRGSDDAVPLDTGDLRAGAHAAAARQTGRTDAEGGFRISGIAAFPARVEACRSGWVCVHKPEHELRQARSDLRVVVCPRARIGVRAFDAATRQPLGAFDLASREGSWWSRCVVGQLSGPPPQMMCELQVIVNEEAGMQRPRSLPVVLSAWGYRQQRVDLTLRYPDEPGDAPWHDVSLEPLPARREVGSVLIQATYPALGRLPQEIVLSLRGDALDLGPESDAVAAGHLQPDPLTRATQRLVLHEGRATIELPVGLYDLALEGPGAALWPPAWQAFEVRRGETTAVDVRVPGAVVEVRALTRGGAPVPFFSAQVQSRSAGAYRWHRLVLEPDVPGDADLQLYGAEAGVLRLPVATSTKTLAVGVNTSGFQRWATTLVVDQERVYEVEAVLEPTAEAK